MNIKRLVIVGFVAVALSISTTALAKSETKPKPKPGKNQPRVEFKGDTQPNAVPITFADAGDFSAQHTGTLWLHYNNDIWFVYNDCLSNNNWVDGWAWSEAHETSDYNSPLHIVDSIRANQRLFDDGFLVDSDLHAARSNAAADQATVDAGGYLCTAPIVHDFESTSEHEIRDSDHGNVFRTDYDSF